MSSTEPDAPQHQRTPHTLSGRVLILRVAATLFVLWLVFFVLRAGDKLPKVQGKAAEDMVASVETTVRAAGGLIAPGNCEMIQKGHISVICRVVVQRQALKSALQTRGWVEAKHQSAEASARSEYSRGNEQLILEGTDEGIHTFSIRRNY